MKIIEKDILTVEYAIIAHQVNCQGVMGEGLALKIARKWPAANGCYLAALKNGKGLSDITYGMAGDGSKVIVAHLFGQYDYGRDKRYTDYPALSICLERLNSLGERLDRPIYLPYGLGCGLAGGRWSVVRGLIEFNCPSAIVCKLPEVGDD
jgi:O-acetyl-ADP-ribose deacetylase (regulator of RNase III)